MSDTGIDYLQHEFDEALSKTLAKLDIDKDNPAAFDYIANNVHFRVASLLPLLSPSLLEVGATNLLNQNGILLNKWNEPAKVEYYWDGNNLTTEALDIYSGSFVSSEHFRAMQIVTLHAVKNRILTQELTTWLGFATSLKRKSLKKQKKGKAKFRDTSLALLTQFIIFRFGINPTRNKLDNGSRNSACDYVSIFQTEFSEHFGHTSPLSYASVERIWSTQKKGSSYIRGNLQAAAIGA